ncbi:MAG TPA: hypothetical protein VGG54_04565, partial [Trebonia sp.]
RNLAWAFAYNVAAVPLAALGLLNPIVASVAMTLSSLFVVANSLRLQRYPLRSAPPARTDRESAVRGRIPPARPLPHSRDRGLAR